MNFFLGVRKTSNGGNEGCLGFRQNFALFFAILCAMCLCGPLVVPLHADVTGRIGGVVKDQSQAVVPDCVVTITQNESGWKQQTTTNAEGVYAFLAVPIGHYDMEFQKPGFLAHREVGLKIDVNTVSTVDVILRVGEVSEKVTVSLPAVEIETTSTQMGEVISAERMTSVPLNGRNYTDLLTLQPGVAPINSGEGYGGPAVNGARESANAFMVNGGNVNEGQWMGPGILPNLDSIAEFRIITNNFDAEYGNYNGSQVNVATKSGTNDFHGSAFEFLRNTAFDAANYFTQAGTPKGKLIQNQFGGTFGGPILRNKLFFYADYQGTRQISGPTTLALAPDEAQRSGNFQGILQQFPNGSLPGSVAGSNWAQILSNELGYPVTSGEPYYTAGCVSTTNCVFPNAQIPQSAINPISTNLLKYVPLPNNGIYYSNSALDGTEGDDEGAIRIDDNTRFGLLSGYYFYQSWGNFSPYANSPFPGFGGTNNGTSQMANVGLVTTLNPTTVNEFRVHFMRLTTANMSTQGLGVTLASLGFTTGEGTLGIIPQNLALEGVPPISTNSWSIGVNPFPGSRFNNTYQLIDNFSKTWRAHNFKFGAQVSYEQITNKLFGANNGLFGFTGAETGSDIVDFLIGAPSYFAQGIQYPLHMRGHYFGIYGQDSWRMTPGLVLNYGLRWDVPQPWSEANGEIPTLVPGLQSRVFPGAPTGYVFPGDPGIPKTLAPVRYNNFAPRIGLAYSPDVSEGWLKPIFGSRGNSSLRVSFGIFYTALEEELADIEIGSAPYGNYYASPAPPVFATPFIDRSTGFVEGQKFPVPPLVPGTPLDWSQFTPISSTPGFWYQNRTPYSEQYSLSFQRQLGTGSSLNLAYVGSQGHALISAVEANPGNAALCLSLSQPQDVAPGSPTCGPFGENTIYTAADGTVVNGTRGPFGNQFGSNALYETIGNSAYNSFQATWKYVRGPLDILVGYTFSKSLDDASAFSEMLNPYNARLSRALSAFDVTHNFVASYQWHMPIDKLLGKNRWATGWALAGITHISTGIPVTLQEADDQSLLGLAGGGASVSDTPNYTPGDLQLGRRSVTANGSTAIYYFNPSLFSPSALGHFGNANKRFFHGPGLNNFDIALLKDTHITEHVTLQFRAEFFNALNHPQFGNPDGNVNSATFGQVLSAADPRIGQFALKLLF